MMRARNHDPLPVGLALLALGAGVALVTLLSLGQADVDYARTEWTALLAMLLAAPAIILYVISASPPGRWWRAFWTAGAIAYLMHFWWAIFRTYHGELGAVFARQGWVAWTNFAVTVLWVGDVASAWLAGVDRARPIRLVALRFVAWAGVTASFAIAAAVFRTGTVALLGMGLAAGVVVALGIRLASARARVAAADAGSVAERATARPA